MHIDQSRQYMTTRQIDCPVVRLKRDPTAYGNDFTVFDRQIARFEPSVPIELRTIENRLHFAVPFRTSPQRVHKNRATWTATLITWKIIIKIGNIFRMITPEMTAPYVLGLLKCVRYETKHWLDRVPVLSGAKVSIIYGFGKITRPKISPASCNDRTIRPGRSFGPRSDARPPDRTAIERSSGNLRPHPPPEKARPYRRAGRGVQRSSPLFPADPNQYRLRP